MSEVHVLLSNDDGIGAHGLELLEETISALPGFRVTVVAPATEQSATSHSLTLLQPLRIREHGPRRYSVTGTPTDTVMVAIEQILKDDRPDLVLSGINHGPNLGEDVLYSGTVAAAMEGTMLGIPSVALSLASWHPSDFTGAAAFTGNWIPKFWASRPEPRTILNLNFPDGPPSAIKGARVVRLGSRVYKDAVTEHKDPRGRPYIWIGGNGPTWQKAADTDRAALDEGYVSITPLRVDLTDVALVESLQHLATDIGAKTPK